ncbi:hypothetical protein NLG97_g3318 [Lecanicillium saksenae]|uniref:Uncharacterized protein n=1 Tax=Lecanicillium saksenae TaxID=468837 RepID=A0ACC1QZU7_9HYPO|nr:hypothetical protein NLG97_g3318 [Lecanicillium saksenae]
MSKLSASRKGSSQSSMQQQSPLPVDNMLHLASAEWVAGLSIASPYTHHLPLSLVPSSQSISRHTTLTPHSQSSQHSMFSDMPVPTFEHGHYMTMNSQLPWSSDSLMVPPLHPDISSQGSSPSARLSSESPSFQDAEGEAEAPSEEATEPPKKPKRSRPNRYKNAPPAVIQRRRAANRKSQQAYRKRKDDRIAELEELLNQSTKREQEMSHAYMTLRAEYEQLLLAGSPGASTHHARSPSDAGSAYTAAPTTTEVGGATVTADEEAAAAFLSLASFTQNDGSNQQRQQLSPGLAHPHHMQRSSASPHLLSVYPPPPM